MQLTDADGMVEFETIYPGWYTGRTVHIHLKVIAGGEVGDGDPAGEATSGDIYIGGHTSHTGQLFFDDSLSDEVYQLEPYSTRTGQRTLNTGDNILGDHADEPGFIVDISRIAEDDIAGGLVGTITIGVDPSATPQEAAGGGPGGPPPGA